MCRGLSQHQIVLSERSPGRSLPPEGVTPGDSSLKGTGTMNQDHIRDAAAAGSAEQAIEAASRRRDSAVKAAQALIDNATAAERAEQDTARSALAASIRRLLAEELNIGEIAALCRIST